MKVSELTGPELDRWAALAHGMKLYHDTWQPSRNWAQGGPLIEQERISINQDLDQHLGNDHIAFAHMPGKVWEGCFGATPLEAAMRCFVASKFGEEVQE